MRYQDLAPLGDIPEIQAADRLKAELDAMRPLGSEEVGRAMQRMRIEWTYHSNAIEGNSLTYGETRALLMHGVTAKGKPLKDHLDIKGHREALDFLELIVQGERQLSLATIRELHKHVLGQPYESWAETPDGQRTKRLITPGEFKTQPNHVRTETGEIHYFAPPSAVDALMQDLVDDAREGMDAVEAGDLHPLVLATDLHHRFAAIHPFDDGNGRMTRILMNLVLMRSGYPPAVLRQENRPTYYGTLAQADSGDLEPLLQFIAGETEASLRLYLRALQWELSSATSDKEEAPGMHLSR
jgi:Fic family protein